MVIAMCCGLFWILGLYASALRDPRYLDGWVLAGGVGLQLYYHVARKRARLPPKSAKRWRRIHILAGYVMIAAFAMHSDFSMPDTELEWALWVCFVLVATSGLFGTYLAWSLRTKRGIDETLDPDRIPMQRAELAREVHAVIFANDAAAAAIPLPALPYDHWIADLYTHRLRDFFAHHRNTPAHLMGSRRPLEQLVHEIDDLTRYVDRSHQEILATIKTLVVEKDRLDLAAVHLGLTRGWLWVHVPVTYSLIVLSVLHVVVVYSYSAGAL